MLPITLDILENHRVRDAEGTLLPVHSHTDRAKGEFLQGLLRKVDASVAVEIGLAYGVSALFICEVLAEQEAPQFISIDPLQSEWKDIGLLNLESAGFLRFTEFHRDYSNAVLPELLRQGASIDFAFVDGDKTFDSNLHDAMYLTRLLRVGGIMVFDDCEYPSLRRLVRYLAKWPHLQVAGTHSPYSPHRRRRILSSLVRRMPAASRIFRSELVDSAEVLGVNAGCVAFQKIAEDSRPWDWWVEF